MNFNPKKLHKNHLKIPTKKFKKINKNFFKKVLHKKKCNGIIKEKFNKGKGE